MKKISILILTIVLSMTICFVPSVTAFAAGSPVTVTAGTLDYSDEAQTVTVTIAVNPGVEITAYGGNVVLPEGWSVNGSVKVKGTDKDGDAFTSKQDPAADNNYSFNQIATMTATSVEITYNVPESASGEFTLGATNLILSKDGMNQLEGDNNGITATTNVIIAEPAAPGEGYTVALSTNASADGITEGTPFNVNLDVSNPTATMFNAFYAKLTYDNTKLSYTGEEEVSGFTVKSDTAGMLIISKTGESVTINANTPELVLPFTAEEKGSATLGLSNAKVDVAANAEKDADPASIDPESVTVVVKETPPIEVEEEEYVGTGENVRYKLIVVKNAVDGTVPTYTYGDPAKTRDMYKLSGEGYEDDQYYFIIPGNETYDALKLSSRTGTVDVTAVNGDVNMTNTIDINDAQFVYNICNGTNPTKDYVEELIRADANRSGNINVSDCATVVQLIPVS